MYEMTCVDWDAPSTKATPEPPKTNTQWEVNGTILTGTGVTSPTMPPGVYEIGLNNQSKPVFSRLAVSTQGLLRFPGVAETIIGDITRFWDRGAMFAKYGLPHKRGILLYGPPGGGKSSILRLLMADVVARGGIVVKFPPPPYFTLAMRVFREVQPETPVVVLMEDIDGILDEYEESAVLNILDGVDRLERAVFLATTNYPEKLGPRIINRPSRFDKRFKIGCPDAECRLLYLKHITGDAELLLDQWVRDTEGMSLAHIQELFTAVVILGDEYKESLATVKGMESEVSSRDDVTLGAFGFKVGS